MSYETIENLYLIKISKYEDLKNEKMAKLEEILKGDERALLKNLIPSIHAASAFIYDTELIECLKRQGYELIPQEKNFLANSTDPS